MKTLICDCNKTMPLDGPALARAIGTDAGFDPAGVHSLLCRREAASFQRAARSSEELLVACTQESRLFAELATATEGAPALAERPIRFVDIRETGGWSKDAAQATPKIAALIAAAALPAPEPVAAVSYASAGRVLVVAGAGQAERAERAAAMLADRLDVTILLPRAGGTLAQAHGVAVHAGRLTRLAGWLGAFDVAWSSGNPIDLDLCTRCNACLDACPEGAIDYSYQIDLARCTGHRACVRACGAAAAIDFTREPAAVEERFDLVLDLGEVPAIDLHQPPQGYFRAADDASLLDAVLRLRDGVGEFEKARFFQYRDKLCAHSRNGQLGCTACIDVCSAAAIASDAGKGARNGKGGIVVEPHLCVGCGACTTVCPSGALTYAAPRPNELGAQIRTLLSTYARAGGRDAVLLVHSQEAGARVLGRLGRAARTSGSIHGVPANVLPLAVWHTASVGIDLWLAAIAFGAAQVWVLVTDQEAPAYREAISAQMATAEAIVQGLGFAGEHFRLVGGGEVARLPPPAFERGPAARRGAAAAAATRGPARRPAAAVDAAETPGSSRAPDPTDVGATGLDAIGRLDQALRRPTAATVRRAATFAVQADKRTTLDLALQHLLQEAASAPETIALPGRAPRNRADAEVPLFGNVVVDRDACTLCLACVGACPEGALVDNPERPQLRFIERHCVQCGLCETTCPENAITLEPRLLLADGLRARREARVVNEVEPYRCIRCAKPFGTLRAIEAMLGRLAGHAMFQGAAADRLKMCGDCRVIDLHSASDEVRIGDL